MNVLFGGGECLDSCEARESKEVRDPVRGAQSLDGAAAAGVRCRRRRTVACGRWVHWQKICVLDDGSSEVSSVMKSQVPAVREVGGGPLTHPRESHELGSAGTDTTRGVPAHRHNRPALETRQIRPVPHGQLEHVVGRRSHDGQPCERQTSPFEGTMEPLYHPLQAAHMSPTALPTSNHCRIR
jgi:hypothetical protein